MVTPIKYSPGELITSTTQSKDKALIILNTPLMNKHTLKALWSSCSWHICADGGANRLHDMWGMDEESSRQEYVSAALLYPCMRESCKNQRYLQVVLLMVAFSSTWFKANISHSYRN